MKPRTRSLLIHAFAATAALSLAACGGDGDDSPAPTPPPPPPPAPITLSGEVARIGTLRNVVVCLDLNANDACDAGEPASAATGADGRYSLSYDPAAVSGAASAQLIAPVKTGDPAAPTTAIDSYNPAVAATSADYLMRRPAGSGGAINPLTTLVQAGVAAGMTQATARANVALQLAIDAAKIDAYQDDPAWDDAQVHDTARTAAGVVSGMLRTGVPLEVGDQQAAAAASSTLRQLRYSAPGDYYARSLDQQAKAAGSAGVQLVENRSGKSGGQVNADEALYGTAYLTPNGWTYCTRNVLLRSTVGNPSRSVYCDGETSLGSIRASSVSGAMADLVDRWQALPSNTINAGVSTAGLKGALGATVFPAGAEELVRSSVVLGQTILIDTLANRAQPQSRNTLEALISHYPSSGAAAPTGANTLSLAVTTGLLKNLRVSFGSNAPQGVAQYYECDLNAEQTVVSNCVRSTTGAYSIETVHGARVLRFTGQPPTPFINYHVVYTEIRWVAGDPKSQWVYRAHETKPGLSARQGASHRLNDAAWTAMKTRLGI
ncbi:MAG: hypothetical protein JSS17_06645 [Proteobacteria bacterium]|nr:hypothetical protein [Pseudomonadota bacterium]